MGKGRGSARNSKKIPTSLGNPLILLKLQRSDTQHGAGSFYPTRKNSTDCPALTARLSHDGISPCPSQLCPAALR